MPEQTPPSRWGKINHGQSYGLIADDVARRLATLRMGDYERLLFNHIREYSWARSTRRKSRDGSWPDALPFDETITSIARQACGPIASDREMAKVRKRLYEAAKTLKDDRFLIATEGPADAILINTKVDDWDVSDREFLPQGGRWYASAAQNSQPKEEEKVSAKTGIDVRQNGQAYPPERANISGKTGMDVRQNGYSHIEDRAQGDLIQTKEDNTLCVSTAETATNPARKSEPDTFADPDAVADYAVREFRDDDNRDFYRDEAKRWFDAGHTPAEIGRALGTAKAKGTMGLSAMRFAKGALDIYARDARSAREADKARPARNPGSPSGRLSPAEERRQRQSEQFAAAKARRAQEGHNS